MNKSGEQLAKTDIITEHDVEILVHTFYDKIRANELLAPIFNEVIKDNWDGHLKKMCDFWSTILLYTRKYLSDPMVKHVPLPLQKIHFNEWLLLFSKTVDELFSGEIAEIAKKRAGNIARVMQGVKNITI